MRPVKDPDLPEQHDGNPTASPLAYLRPKLYKQSLNIPPGQVAADGAREDQLQGPLVSALHFRNNTMH